MQMHFDGEIWFWRGPAPFYFVSVPPDLSDDIRAVAAEVSYGWGVIPVEARIGSTTWTTSLFPKGDLYALPIKVAVRRAESVDDGDHVAVTMTVLGPH